MKITERVDYLLLGGTLLTIVLVSVLSAADERVFSVVSVLAVYGAIAGLIRMQVLTTGELGLARPHWRRGVKTALPFIATILIGAGLALLITPESLQDERYQVPLSDVLWQVLVVIPIMTAIFEELVFRGVLFAALKRSASQGVAIIVSSLIFGLWHIRTAGGVEGVIENSTGDVPGWMAVVAIVIVTSLAGAFFTLLRLRSQSLLTPILVHWAINSTGAIAAYMAWQL